MKNEIKANQVGQLLPIAMVIVATAVGVAVGLQMMGDVQDDMTASSAEYNATADGITAVSKIPAKLPLIVTAVILGILLVLIGRFAYMKFAN